MSPPVSTDALLAEARSALASGQVDAAKARVDRASALKLEPRHAELLFLLGNELGQRNEPAAAIAVFERALKLAPGNPSLLNNLGLQLDATGEPDRAERCYRDVLARRPGEVAALANLAQLLFVQERYREALEMYDRLVVATPDALAEVWNNRGVCQKSIPDSAAAEESFRRALALQPDSPQVLANLGFLLYERVRYDEARPLMRRAHGLDPGRLQLAAQLLDLDLQFADWRDFDRRRAQIVEGVRTLTAPDRRPRQTAPPFTLLALCDDPSLQWMAAKSFAWPQAADTGRAGPIVNAPPAHRLRIGFVSAAFKEHPETRLLIGLLERLVSDRFDIYAYALEGAVADPMRARVAKLTRGFRELERMSVDQIVTTIRDDTIAVLFDLTGHTAYARPGVFAARPAPVQVNFLGFAGTLGAAYYDYIITDAYTTPQDASGGAAARGRSSLGARRADCAFGILEYADLAPFHRQRVEHQEPARERFAGRRQQLQRLRRLGRADDADQRRKHAHGRAAGLLEVVSLAEQTVVTGLGPVTGVEHRDLAIETNRRA